MIWLAFQAFLAGTLHSLRKNYSASIISCSDNTVEKLANKKRDFRKLKSWLDASQVSNMIGWWCCISRVIDTWYLNASHAGGVFSSYILRSLSCLPDLLLTVSSGVRHDPYFAKYSRCHSGFNVILFRWVIWLKLCWPNRMFEGGMLEHCYNYQLRFFLGWYGRVRSISFFFSCWCPDMVKAYRFCYPLNRF